MDADELEIWRALNELPEVKAVFGAGYTGDRVYILTVAAACQRLVSVGGDELIKGRSGHCDLYDCNRRSRVGNPASDNKQPGGPTSMCCGPIHYV
jgi:hypothetical protein